MHLLMQMIGKKLSKVRWTQFFLMGHGNSLNDPRVANQWVVSGYSRRSLSLKVLLASIRLDLLPKEGEDFFDTYSPVARLSTIRALLFLAALNGLIIHQMDVKTAFVGGQFR